ncbi:MAG: phosphotransferase [Nitrososphaeria archaeon]
MGLKKINILALTNYLSLSRKKGNCGLIPQMATNIKIRNLKKIHGSMSDIYEFSTIYRHHGKNITLELILKLYKEKRMAEKEFKILKNLKNVGFPVPHVYMLNTEEMPLGAPFVIMEKINGRNIKDYIKHLSKEEIFELFKQMAEILATLHKLGIKGFTFLEQPKDEYAYAKKQTLKEETWAKDAIMKNRNFKWISRWLEYNATKCPCFNYSLIHGDMNANNFLIDDRKKIFFLDWTGAEIGDPLMDLGYVYCHLIMDLFNGDFRDKIFSHFLKHYQKKTGLKIDKCWLRFYVVAAGLREAIFLNYQCNKIWNLAYFIKIFGAKYLPFIPVISWLYRRKLGKVQSFLKNLTADYEEDRFGTMGGKILSLMEINNILSFLKLSSTQLILDLGTGSGRIAREILKKSDMEIVGVDVSKQNVQSAKARALLQGNLQRYHLIVADGQYLPFRKNTFDSIICVRTLKYIKKYGQAISEMRRVLKPRQVLVLDLSSSLGYESILRYITPSMSARAHHVFNFYKMRSIIEANKFSIDDYIPVEKVPYKLWELSERPTFLRILLITDNILSRITPKVLSRSILVKCIKKSEQ